MSPFSRFFDFVRRFLPDSDAVALPSDSNEERSYSAVEIVVREATSDDPSEPSEAQMLRIAENTFTKSVNPVSRSHFFELASGMAWLKLSGFSKHDSMIWEPSGGMYPR